MAEHPRWLIKAEPSGSHLALVQSMPFGTNLLASQLALSSLAIYQRDRFLGTILAKRDIRQAQKVLRHKRIDTAAAHYVLDEKGATIFEQRFSSPVFPTVLVRTLLKQT